MAERAARAARKERSTRAGAAAVAAPMGAEISFGKFNRKARTSHDQVARALGVEIVSGIHSPGTKLPHESEILLRFGISRTVLREALKTLTAKGLIASKSRVGTKVLDATHWNLFDADVLAWRVSQGFDEKLSDDLAEIRTAIEPRAAALAAQRADAGMIAILRRCVADMRAATESRRQFAEADLEFHRAVGVASGNMLMRALSAVIETALVESFTVSAPDRDLAELERVVRRHERIVDAIESREPNLAAAAMNAVIVRGVGRAEPRFVT